MEKTVKPFLKWAGGKRQLLNRFRDYYPEQLKRGGVKRYCEPFLGGGAVFFDIASRYRPEEVFLFDINEELILLYRVVQRRVEALVDGLAERERHFKSLHESARESYYYSVRSRFNQEKGEIDFSRFSDSWIKRAVEFIFLNKTCYNGLFRLNRSGHFNTPYGRYKNPGICPTESLQAASLLLENAEILCAGFDQVGNFLNEETFVYYDPPYRPLSRTSAFTAYSRHPFGDEEQRELAALFHQGAARGALQMLSNSDPRSVNPADDFFDKLYGDYRIVRVDARRAINSKGDGRAPVKEVLIMNY